MRTDYVDFYWTAEKYLYAIYFVPIDLTPNTKNDLNGSSLCSRAGPKERVFFEINHPNATKETC